VKEAPEGIELPYGEIALGARRKEQLSVSFPNDAAERFAFQRRRTVRRG
jgi:hypothetical protein